MKIYFCFFYSFFYTLPSFSFIQFYQNKNPIIKSCSLHCIHNNHVDKLHNFNNNLYNNTHTHTHIHTHIHTLYKKNESSNNRALFFEDYQLKKNINKVKILNHNEKKSIQIIKKGKAFFQMTRPSNILPVAILNLIGGTIANPSILQLLTNNHFLILMFVTQLVSSGSMVVNDIFDYEIDKINNKNRPLPKGIITIKEALFFFFLLISIALYLNTIYLKSPFVLVDTLLITLYTPVFKKIPIIKNIICATVVSSSIFISGISATHLILPENEILLFSTCKLLFSYSIYLEIMLDISDKEGDKQNGINTLPVLFGNDISIVIAFISLSIGIVSAIISTGQYFTIIPYYLYILSIVSFINIVQCKFKNYSNESINEISKNTTYSILFYFFTIFISRLI